MQKKYNSLYRHLGTLTGNWPLIVFISFAIGLLSYSFNYAQEAGFITWTDVTDKLNNKPVAAVEPDIRSTESINFSNTVHGPPLANESKIHSNTLIAFDDCTSPYSTLPCDQIAVNVPFQLNFDGTEGGLAVNDSTSGSGFTMALPHSAPRLTVDEPVTNQQINGYELSKLALNNGRLTITSSKGIMFRDPIVSPNTNSQVNALGVGINGSQRLRISTTLTNPFSSVAAADNGSQQAGIWYGINDNNYVKLVLAKAGGTNTQAKVQLVVENYGTATTLATTPAEINTANFNSTAGQQVTLILEIDPLTGTAAGYYQIAGGSKIVVSPTPTSTLNSLAVPSFIRNGVDHDTNASTEPLTFVGLHATHRNSTNPVNFSFENFSIDNFSTPVSVPFRINAGGSQLTAGSNVFTADEYFSPIPGEVSNATYSNPVLSNGGPEPQLYYDRRFGANINYNIPIVNGNYQVKLHMVENFQTSADKRKFDVDIEGVKVIDDIDLFVDGGYRAPIIKTFDVSVTDGQLNIAFVASIDKAIINAIEILPAPVASNQAPVFENTLYTFTKEENTAIGTEVGTISATDADGHTLTYSLTAGNQAGKFAINASTGLITLASALDYSTVSEYTLTVEVTDNGTPALSATTQVSINVTEVLPENQAPVVVNAITSQTTTSGSSFSFLVPSNTFSDEDGDALTLTASLADDSVLPAWLSFNGTTFSGNPQTAGNYSIKLTATDGKATASTLFSLTVEAAAPVNTAPVFASTSYSFSKEETAAVGSLIGSVSATDADGHSLVYSITAGNQAGKFAIDAGSGEITLAAALDYTTTAVYSLTVTATDNGTPVQSASAQLTINVTEVLAVNHTPVVANVLENKTATVGTIFSFAIPANTFSDEDGDELTLTASLADDSNLPAWLLFNGNTLSGLPTEVATYSIKVVATDGKASVSTEFTLTVSAAPIVACLPISTFPCNQVAVNIPFSLTFNGTEGGLSDKEGIQTGFTMADAYTGTRRVEDGTPSSQVRGYEPSRLTIANSRLSILSNKGISIVGNNNQINALGVAFNASQGRFVIETTLINPYKGSNDEQGGLWYGLNDKTFIRLAINNNRVVLRKELNDLSPITSDLNDPSRRNTASITNLNSQTVRLRIVVDPTANTVEGFYSTNGTTYINVGEGYPVKTLDIADMGITGANVHAGVFNTHRNATTPIIHVFDNFTIRPEEAPVNTAPVFANATYTFSKEETAAIGATVGSVSATDVDGHALVYSITAGNAAGKFAINPTSGEITLAAALDYSTASSYSLTLQATDNGTPALSATAQVTVNVSKVNKAPVIVSAPEAQTITAGQPFSFQTGSFSDPDASDVLTYSASLADNSVLPAWVQFNAATQVFSGTAPVTPGSITIRVTATDQALASVSATFAITIEAVQVIPCSPISTLPCDQINVPLPYVLNFDGNEGGLTDKNNAQLGFTMVDAYTGTRLAVDGTASSAVIGYEPSKLTLANGRLSILTNKGIAFTNATQENNNQLNTLGVGVMANGKLTLETTVVNPFNGTSSEQGGLWFGINDKTFLKLVVSGNRVELRKELNDVSNTAGAELANPDQRITLVINGLNTQTVRLRMVVDLVAGTAEAFYSTDGITYVNAGARYATSSLNVADMALAGKQVYTGIFATHRNATTPVTFTFDNFSVTSDGVAAKVLAFSPTALDFTVLQGGTITAKSAVLSASAGTPVVSLTKSTASWLTLPAAGLGTLTFGAGQINSAMAPGIYEATVTANAEGYMAANLTIRLTVTSPVAAQEIKVNFQDPATTPPTGWVSDYGQPFGARIGANQGNALEYGWKARSNGSPLDLSVGGTTPGNGRNRNTTLNPDIDVLLATLMHMQADDITGTFNGTKAEGYWEIKVANGEYNVTVTAGDGEPGTVPEIHSLNVEGVSAISGFVPAGTAGTLTRFRTATVRVTVTDGLLTINADGGTNTKINSAIITPVNVSPFLHWSANEQSLVIERGTAETNKTFSLDLVNSTGEDNAVISLTANYGGGAANWLSFNATHTSSEPNVTFDYTAAKNLPLGTYTVLVTASAQGFTSAITTIQITVVEPGSIQPYVVSSTPANGATNVSVNIASIAANDLFVPEVPGFKGGVNNETLNTSTVKLLKISGSSTTEILGIVQGTGGGDAISFSPTFALEPNTTYKFVVTAGVKAYSGASFLPYEATFTTGELTTPDGPTAVEFAPKQVIPGTIGKKYTSLTFGPDGRFYALRLDGVIERFVVDRETGMLSGQTEIRTVINKYGARSAVGLVFDPASTPSNLIAYVSHCTAGLTNAPEFDGNLSRLTGGNLETEQLVLTKLPRSAKDHLVNNIVFGPDGALYFCQGSNSSMGAYDGTWQREESLLAGAVLRLDLQKLAGLTLPLDVRTTANQSLINAAPAANIRMSDGTYNPYATNSPLTIYASGVRNAYDLLWHSNGQLYVPTNGSAAGGNSPASVMGTRRPDGSFYNGPVVPATTSVKVQNDWLFRVNPFKPVGFFGHPNPLRGEYVTNRGYLDNPKYATTQGPDANYRGAAFNFELNKSPNGVIEYKSNAFGGALKGRILVCRFSGGSDIIILEPGSMENLASINSADDDDKIYDIVKFQTGSGTNGVPGLSGFTNPLDITEDVQTGNLYVIEYNWNNTAGQTAQLVLLKATTPSAPVGIASVSPAKIVDNDVAGGEAGKTHTITLANKGNTTLLVTGITLAGTDVNQFQLLGAPAASTASPVSIAPNSAITFNVAFNPTSVGVKTAKLSVTSVNNTVKEVALNGLGTIGLSGSNEPSLQAVLDVHGINVNVGDDNKSTNIIHSNTTQQKAALLGEEIAAQRFQRAEDGPVTIQPLSVFGPTHTGGIVTGFGWYVSGDANAKNELFTVANSSYQTVDVQTTGNLSFDPGTASFGFYSRWPFFNNRHLYSEDALNTFEGTIPHHVRVYPLKNTDGTVVENAYIIATEEHISGFDYQDVVVIAYNVKPVVVRELTFSTPSIAFTHTPGLPTATQTVSLSANTGTPALTLTKSAGSDWLVLPQPALGALTFGINETGLATGTYSATVTAAASGYTSATLTVSLTVNAPAPFAVINVSNNELIFDGVKSTTITKRLTITNTGNQMLNLGNVTISGTNASNFIPDNITVEGEPTGNAIGPDETKTLQISFVPGSAVATFNAVLNIPSDALNSPALSVGLYGMSLNGFEGNNEPPLQTVVDVLGYKINVGWTTLADGIQATLKGEEVAVQLFEKATEGVVTILPVARYSPNQELPFGFYTKQNEAPLRTAVGTLSGVSGQHQALFPQIVAGSDRFDPQTGVFGIYVQGLQNRLSYTEDPLNAGGPALHAVRTYPLKDRQGVLVPNSYLVCFEDASNGDYQDYVFVLQNVIPAGTRKALAFNPTSLNFNVPLNGTTAAKIATLSASNGTPASVSLTKSANSNWLILPATTLGDLSFGVNVNGLAAGVYTATVTAAAAGYTNATLTVNMRIADIGANATRINFQLATTATPAGYLADAGLAYSEARGYGWVNPTTKVPKDHTASMRERTSATVETRLRTLALMQSSTSPQTPGSWEMKVAPGQYNVTVGVGDLDFFDSNHTINVEGVAAITNFIPTAQNPFRTATVTVEVTDGMLTIDANGGTNTKINFVIVDQATAEGDFIPPVASVQFKGALQTPGIYRNNVVVSVNASDAGGSELANVLYSINNGPFTEYYTPLLINTAGTYSIRARAIDGNGNEFTSAATAFSVVIPELNNTSMLVENLDKFPANDRLTFSLIQEPWRRSNGDGTFTPYNRNHDQVKVRISNKGAGVLNISNLGLTNTAAWKITQVNNVVFDAATMLPLTINPGSSVEVGIQFVAQFTSGRIRILNDTLHIASNDDFSPRKSLVLHGMWQARGEGGNEPYASEIIRAFGFKTSTGFNSNDGTNAGTSLLLNTDEILSSFFVKADAGKPVYVIQMGAYHGCCSSVESFQWYAKGSTTNTTVFAHNSLDGQSLLPMRNASSTLLADGTFNPTGAFGFKVSASYSDRTRNSEGKIGVRVWKAIDPNGNIIPNAYIIGHDYIGTPGVTNYDYQDNVFYISNVKPEVGAANFSELAAAPSAVDFGSKQIGTNTNRTIDLKNLGLTYANGSSDPAITIKSVEIVGANLNEFTVSTPASVSLAPQATTTVTVGFRPGSRGIKNAALLVYYNSSLSPLRIPLYGIADDNCSVISVAKRIKSGADANVSINGKAWEADRTYRQGSVQLDKPAATPIASTEDDVLYQTYLSSTTNLAEIRYQIPVTNGNYMVRMHFVENFFTVEGSRVFSINIENQTRLTNLDIFREVGYKVALVKDFEVGVSDGRLDIRFNPTANRLAIAGLEIFTTATNPNAIALTQQSVTGSECGVANGSITLGVTNSTATSLLYKVGQNGTYQTSPVFANLASGLYTFYVKENVTGGCETSSVFTIPDRNNNLAFTVNAPLLSCNALTGSATVTNITGGSGNYTITWNTLPVQTGATANNLAEGVYTVTVTDATGCSKSQEVTVGRQTDCQVATLRINAGGPQVSLPSGVSFSADQYFNNTYTYQNLNLGDIANTTDDVLYRTERGSNTDMGTFAYNIPVRNGNHKVVLHFAEIYFVGANDAGKRVFDVRMEGQTRLSNYDIVADGGAMAAITKSLDVSVTDGTLTIEFAGKVNRPKVSAIEVISSFPVTNNAPVLATIDNKTVMVGQTLSFTATATDADASQTKTYSLVGAPQGATINATTGAFSWTPAQTGSFSFTVKVTDNGTPALSDEEQITVLVSAVGANAIRINAGGAAFMASGNRQFIADTYFSGTTRTFSLASGDILNTTDDVLYHSERSDAAFSYNIPVSNGTYNVVLHFAEIWYGAPGGGAGGSGKRLFHVDMEGSRKLTNYDIYAAAGGAMRPVQSTWPVTVADGTLNINFLTGAANMPKVSAIEVIPVSIVNQAPVLATIGNKTVTVGQTLSFTATATDADASQTKTYSLVGAPQGATINATTGAFSWTPAQTGSFSFTVKVTDNGTPALSDEEQITVLVSAVGANAIRINAGGTTQTVNGTTWAGCVFGNCNNYVSGGFPYTPNSLPVISGVPSDMNQSIFHSEWTGGATGTGAVAVGAVAFTYNVPVTNGNYLVRLHFVELNKNGQNLRVFDVNLEGGTKELVNFDIFKEAGGMLKAIVREFPVTITDRNVTIQFIRQIENAKVSAIEIIPVSSVNTRITSEVNAAQSLSALSLNIHPNPNIGDKVYVELTGMQMDEQVLLTLTDLNGRVIQSMSATADEYGALKTGMNLQQHIQSGFYILQATTDSGASIYKRIVIQK
ncbi:malectin domain-containing carbohydrate-binding protein [Rhodocytophaga aerolata]|uniref:Malectin domain-containing carbohydrate-binding protein n=1 Tax=Rhodocytophaga aerolata TaxID=455078 RepID=A0ABT8R9N0_9BACT|nr:malectin domain-containing carbohydrate-binding protein [Rhodocytophaga aerolata]MDO1448406.1 malectin domain-containing carbohydrate-binding protein [Rhodocytophaga aerolata]